MCSMMASPSKPRPVNPEDLPQITRIINHYILNSISTFRTEPLEVHDLELTLSSIQALRLPFLVISDDKDTEKILGYAYASGYRMPTHPAYRHTVEISIYVHPDHRHIRIGTLLMDSLMEALKAPEKHDAKKADGLPTSTTVREVLCIVALDDDETDGGYQLSKWYGRWGFVEAGHLKRVGFKLGRWIDTLILQKSLEE